jgi:hypothetical protein
MARYFFHVHDSQELIDREGVELANGDDVKRQAVVTSGELLQYYGDRFWDRAEWRMWVTDESGATVCDLRFSAEPPPPAAAP